MSFLVMSLTQLRRVVLPQRTIIGSRCLQLNDLLQQPSQYKYFSTTSETPSNTDITKTKIVDSIAETHGLSKSQSERILNTVIDTIVEALGDGKTVKIASFGSFEKYLSKPRSATNFQTKERIDVPSKNRIRFKPFKAFKELVEGKKPKVEAQKPEIEGNNPSTSGSP